MDWIWSITRNLDILYLEYRIKLLDWDSITLKTVHPCISIIERREKLFSQESPSFVDDEKNASSQLLMKTSYGFNLLDATGWRENKVVEKHT